MSHAEKLALAAIVVTLLTSVGGWIVQWKVASIQRHTTAQPKARIAANTGLLKIIYAVIWAIIISASLVGAIGITVSAFGLLRGRDLIVYVLFPLSVSVAALTEVVFVVSIRRRLMRLFS